MYSYRFSIWCCTIHATGVAWCHESNACSGNIAQLGYRTYAVKYCLLSAQEIAVKVGKIRCYIDCKNNMKYIKFLFPKRAVYVHPYAEFPLRMIKPG